MKKIVIITGLTGSGKSNLAIEIACEFNGEIISADSVQIYRGLDIGSAKESRENMSHISHHLIDIKDYNETYNVGEFITDCGRAIEDIVSRGKLPIIVGGTGLYVKALLEGYSLGGTAANETYREMLLGLAKDHGNKAIWDRLNELNPEKAKTVHYNNLKRVIRYLEIEKFGSGEVSRSILEDYNVCAVGIIADREAIYSRINNRVDQMIEAGLEDEVRDLISRGATSNMQSMITIGYKEWFDCFNGEKSKAETINLIKQHTRNYCKRQLTFMKTINGLSLMTINEAKDRIKEFLC